MKVMLFAALNAASFVVCKGEETTVNESLIPVPDTMILIGEEDDEWIFKDQEIDLSDGYALAMDDSGEMLPLEFSVHRPMIVEDVK